jgi:LmbE family N-acetylglucosaminyl deacetylase
MFSFSLGSTSAQPLKILCLGAHPDDIEIGCGATMLKLQTAHPNSDIRWVVFSGNTRRADEARCGAERFRTNSAKLVVDVLNFRDGFFPYEGIAIKEYFETLKQTYAPDLILTHYRDDRHQDHRVISDLTWNTFRNHLIWEYEVPKFDGDFGAPNLFVTLEDALVDRKCTSVLDVFTSQQEKHWLTDELLRSVLRIRGMEAGGETRYAEAFYTRKVTI